MLTRDDYATVIGKLLEARQNQAAHRSVWRNDVADALNCSTDVVSNWVRGVNGPEAHSLFNLFKYFGNGFRNEAMEALGHDVDAPPDDADLLEQMAGRLRKAKLENGK